MTEQFDRFERDILAEPEALAATLDAYAGTSSPLEAVSTRTSRVLFAGMGSSRYASLPAASYLCARGADVAVERASAERGSPPSRATLCVCVSASGTTPETLEVAARHRGVSRIVAVTNDPESELAYAADVVLPLHAGEETGGVACRTFQCTLAVLLGLAGRLARDDVELGPAVAAVAAIRDSRAEWRDRALELLGGGPIYAIAPDARLSSAEQSALVFREGPRVPADACETGDWLHVDVYLSKHPGYRALLFPGSRFDSGVMDWLERRGGRAVAVGRPVEGAALTIRYPGAEDELVATLVETSVAELLAAEMWRRSSA